jgi:hypothetical protein
MLYNDIVIIVSCLATRARGRSLSGRRWTTRRLGGGAVLGIGRIAREHPLAHGICSQLLRVLYLAELNGIDSHAVTEAEYLNSFSCVFKLPLERG